jgi:hypothetical protein
MSACLLLALVTALSQAAQDPQAATLKGIHAVSVVVDRVAPAAVKLGFTDSAAREEADRALKAAGIAASGDTQAARLMITINAVTIETTTRATSGIAYTVTLSIEQEASLSRTSETVRAATWRRAGIGVARPGQANAAIRDQLLEYLKAFVDAWKTANSGRGL